MNSKQYKNIIEGTLNNSKMDSTNNHLDIIKNIFKNRGISIPHGDYSEIYKILQSNDYIGAGVRVLIMRHRSLPIMAYLL